MERKKSISVVIPSFQESSALEKHLPEVICVLERLHFSVQPIIINDLGQPDSSLEEICSGNHAALINTPWNMGSQQAILYGIRQQVSNFRSDIVLVMDGDGQDDADAIPDMINAVRPDRIVVAQRVGKRPEGLIFSSLYCIYKGLFRLLTGITPDFGNFSAFDQSIADRIAESSHFRFTYSMALPQLCSIQRVPVKRLKRLTGESTLGYKGLFHHAVLSTLPYLDTIGARIMTGSLILLVISIFLLICTLVLSMIFFECFIVPIPIALFSLIMTGFATQGVILSLVILYSNSILKQIPACSEPYS